MRAIRGHLPLPALCLALGACAAHVYRPQVDLTAANAARYETDLRDCQAVADANRYGPVLAGALQGLAIGAGLGTIIGGFSGGNIGLSATYGGIGGVTAGGAIGGTMAVTQAPADEKTIVEQCLRNNGYEVRG